MRGLNRFLLDTGAELSRRTVFRFLAFPERSVREADQPLPPGARELLVDGWQGKTYQVAITGDSQRSTTFRLSVIHDISCES
jgi:hypothetical protein